MESIPLVSTDALTETFAECLESCTTWETFLPCQENALKLARQGLFDRIQGEMLFDYQREAITKLSQGENHAT
jgi:hypothetical protein